MSEINIHDYKGYSIEPLVYPQTRPRQGKSGPVRRYYAAVSLINLNTQVKHTAKLANDFEFFGDARRAAEARGKTLIDDPALLQELDAEAGPAALFTAPVA